MDPNVVVGSVIVCVALVANIILVCVSKKTIDRVASKRLHSVRDIVREMNNER